MAENEVKKRVLLGMSGGIDSSVSAMLLHENGYEVIGVTFLFSELELQNQKNSKDASQLAQRLGIEHHVIGLKSEFKQIVIQRFLQEYAVGKTPFPCAFCNPNLKFYYLEKWAEKLNCTSIATGHYAQIAKVDGKLFISKAEDGEKDQSFFLWGLNRKLLNKILFPLGKYKKSEVRALAEMKGFSIISNKKDSFGICFAENGDYRKYLKDNGIQAIPESFIDKKGKVLGRHSGIINYTIGQRRGLFVNLNKPVFVSEIRAKTNEIVLSDYNDLYKNKIYIEETYFADKEYVKANKVYIVKIRYRLQDTPCKVKIKPGNRAEMLLLEPVAMVANGQTAVIYENETVLGGGFIYDSE